MSLIRLPRNTLNVVILQNKREISNMDNIVNVDEVLRKVPFDVPVKERHVGREPMRWRCCMEGRYPTRLNVRIWVSRASRSVSQILPDCEKESAMPNV